MIRIAIAEEHTITRWALREALARVPGFEVVGEAGAAAEVLPMIRAARPDVLLLDAAVSEPAGADVLATIRELTAGPLVLVLAASTEPAYAARAVGGGAHGYLGRSADPEALIEAIRAVSRGEPVLPSGVDALIAADAHPAAVLTRREQAVMEMLARGMTSREIAEHFALSIKTIDTHRGHVLKKLRLRNNSELTRFAVKHGYVAL